MSKKFLSPINLPQGATNPITATIGDIFYNTATPAVSVYNGTTWLAVSGGGSSGASLTANQNFTGINTFIPVSINATALNTQVTKTTPLSIGTYWSTNSKDNTSIFNLSSSFTFASGTYNVYFIGTGVDSRLLYPGVSATFTNGSPYVLLLGGQYTQPSSGVTVTVVQNSSAIRITNAIGGSLLDISSTGAVITSGAVSSGAIASNSSGTFAGALTTQGQLNALGQTYNGAAAIYFKSGVALGYAGQFINFGNTLESANQQLYWTGDYGNRKLIQSSNIQLKTASFPTGGGIFSASNGFYYGGGNIYKFSCEFGYNKDNAGNVTFGVSGSNGLGNVLARMKIYDWSTYNLVYERMMYNNSPSITFATFQSFSNVANGNYYVVIEGTVKSNITGGTFYLTSSFTGGGLLTTAPGVLLEFKNMGATSVGYNSGGV